MDKKIAGLALGAVLAVIVFLIDTFAPGSAHSADAGAPPRGSATAVPTAERTAAPGPTAPAPKAAGPTVAPVLSFAVAKRKLGELTVKIEDTGHSYDRENWPHWTSVGNSCDTRESVLQRDGRRVTADDSCRAVSGRWISVYDKITLTESGAIDIDHIVPLKEANRSGTRKWSRSEREAFANDPANLIAVSAASNRQKGDADPGRWRPLNRGSWCWYATAWIDVKHTYRLTADDTEVAGLRSMLNYCRAKRTA